MAAPLSSLTARVETSVQAIQGAHYLCDLQVTGSEPDKKMITLQWYANIPFFGRLIGYIRSKWVDAQSICQEINQFREFHQQELNAQLDKLFKEDKCPEAVDIKYLYQYHLKVSEFVFSPTIAAKFHIMPGHPHTFAQDLTARFATHLRAEELKKICERGENIDDARRKRLRELSDLANKINGIIPAVLLDEQETIGKIAGQQSALAYCEKELAAVPSLNTFSNRLQALKTNHSLSFSETEAKQLLFIIRRIKASELYKQYLSANFDACLKEWETRLKNYIRYLSNNFTGFVENIHQQFAKMGDGNLTAVMASLAQLKSEAAKAEMPKDERSKLTYVSHQRKLLVAALSLATPEQLNMITFPSEIPEAPSEQCDELWEARALSIHRDLIKMDPNLINWNKLPLSFHISNLVHFLAEHDWQPALDILCHMPYETQDQQARLQDGLAVFCKAYYKKVGEGELIPFSKIPTYPQTDKFVYLVLRFNMSLTSESMALADSIKEKEWRQKAQAHVASKMIISLFAYRAPPLQHDLFKKISALDDPIKSTTLATVFKSTYRNLDHNQKLSFLKIISDSAVKDALIFELIDTLTMKYDEKVDFIAMVSNNEIKDEHLLKMLPHVYSLDLKTQLLILSKFTDRKVCSRWLLDFINAYKNQFTKKRFESFLEYIGDESILGIAKKIIDTEVKAE